MLSLIILFPGISSAVSSKAVKQYQKAEGCAKALNSSEAKKRLRQNWEACIKEFGLITTKHKKSDYVDNALFNIANLYRDLYRYSKNLNDLDKAIKTYNDLVKKHSKSPYADDAYYEIGEIYLKQKNSMNEALESYKKLAKLYPKSDLKAKTEKRINEISSTLASVSNKPSEPNQIKEVRAWSYPEYTKIVIEADREIGFSSRRLSQPERLYLDLQNAKIKEELKKDPITVGDGLLKQVRASQHTQKDVRIVLDLDSIDDYRILSLPEPDRLVIEIYGIKYKRSNQNTQEGNEAKGKTARSGNIPLAYQVGAKINTIVLDPGHGGKDPGAIGKNGLMEKDIVLDIAKGLKNSWQKRQIKGISHKGR